MIDLTEKVKGIRFERERQFAVAFFDHDDWEYEPRFFDLFGGTKYKPDFYDAKRDVYIEVIGSRQAFSRNKAKYILMQHAYPLVLLEFRFADGTCIDPGQKMSLAMRRSLKLDSIHYDGSVGNQTKTEQAKRRLREMAERSSVTAVAKDLGVSQQLLYRFLHVPGAGISLKTYDKIEHVLRGDAA